MKPPGAVLRNCTGVILILSIPVTLRKPGNSAGEVEGRAVLGLLFPFPAGGRRKEALGSLPRVSVDTRKERISQRLPGQGFPRGSVGEEMLLWDLWKLAQPLWHNP